MYECNTTHAFQKSCANQKGCDQCDVNAYEKKKCFQNAFNSVEYNCDDLPQGPHVLYLKGPYMNPTCGEMKPTQVFVGDVCIPEIMGSSYIWLCNEGKPSKKYFSDRNCQVEKNRVVGEVGCNNLIDSIYYSFKCGS